MTSCRLQSNYGSTVTLHGGPVVLRPVRATLFCIHYGIVYSIVSVINIMQAFVVGLMLMHYEATRTDPSVHS